MVNLSKTADIFLSQTQIAVISTVGTNSRPHSVPIWYEWDGDHAFMFTGVNTLKWKNLSNNPYASLCVDFREPPYRSVVVRGKVKEIKKPLHDFVKKMAIRYYGPDEGSEFAKSYPDDKKGVVIFQLIPDKIIEELEG
jgi:hypothetical protein